jgi:hypothetical protein
MSCERCREQLAEVAAGAPVPAGVEAHLGACEPCRAELAALRQALAVAEREMTELLAAEPSPGMAVRIRRAVAEAEPAPGWRFGWLWPVAAGAAMALVALAVWVGRAPSPAPRATVAPSVLSQAGSARVAESLGTPVISRDYDRPGPEGSAVPPVDPSHIDAAARARGDSGPTRSHARSRHVVPPEPQVLVPPGEEEALVQFVALVHRERLAPPAFGAAGQPSAALAELAPIDIEPLEIVPLDLAEASGT